MNSQELLRAFARSLTIPDYQVDEFIATFDNPKTLDQLCELNHDFQHHYTSIAHVPEPLYGYIRGEFDLSRYETLEIDQLVDHLLDDMYALLNDDCEDIEDIGIENLTTDNIADSARLDELKTIARQILSVKFGSVVMDW